MPRITVKDSDVPKIEEALALTGLSSGSELLSLLLSRYLPDLREWYGSAPRSGRSSFSPPPPSPQQGGGQPEPLSF